MKTYPIEEHTHSINGVPGRMFAIQEPQLIRDNLVYRSQKWVSQSRPAKGYGTNGSMRVTIRFDDECKNGHMSFSITATVYTDESRKRRDIVAGGCMHEEITKIFPELTPLIKWHLMNTDGPMHYIANTLYQASNRDCNGLTKGEERQLRNGKTGQLAWILEGVPAGTPKYIDTDTCPPETFTVKYIPWVRIGEGKERDLIAARSCAVWPEATDEQLSLEKDELKALLESRLHALIATFKSDIELIGFLWEPQAEL